MVAVLHFEYSMFVGMNKFLYIIAVVFLLSVYIPGLGVELYSS